MHRHLPKEEQPLGLRTPVMLVTGCALRKVDLVVWPSDRIEREHRDANRLQIEQ